MGRWMVGLLTVLAVAGCTDFDPADRRLARQDEYSLDSQQCSMSDGRAVAAGDLVNHSGSASGFGVIVRFLDGDVDLGRPQTAEHREPLGDGETWEWEVSLPTDAAATADLRCNVIQVVIGQDITHDG